MGLFNVYTVSNAYRSDYFQYLSEQWANDTDEFTGAWNRSSSSLITRVKTDTEMPKAQIALTSDTAARLRTIFTFRCTPGQFTGAGSSTMVRGTFIEWEAKLSNVANVDNSVFFMGVNASASATRATTNLIAFGLSSDSLVAVSDNAGTETTTAIAGITLADRNMYRLSITGGQVEYSVNGSILATHTTNLPDVIGYLQFNHDTEAGASNLDVGFVHVFYRGIEDTRSF
jgi:hypothetical protein